MGIHEPPSPDVLEAPLAYVPVDRDVIAALGELGDAIDAFEPVPGPAGESVAKWLTDRALTEPQESTVRVRLVKGKITGVYALCAAQVALSVEDRAQLGGVYYRTQPAILLAQFARAADTPGSAARCSSTRPIPPTWHFITSARACSWWSHSTKTPTRIGESTGDFSHPISGRRETAS